MNGLFSGINMKTVIATLAIIMVDKKLGISNKILGTLGQ